MAHSSEFGTNTRAAGRSTYEKLMDLPAGFLAAIALALFLIGWEVIVKVFQVSPIIAPAPSKILVAFWKGIQDGSLLRHGWVTLQEILLGFGVASFLALLIAFLITQSRLLDRAFYPLVVMTQTIPKIAIAPLLIVWFGTGLTSKVVTAALISFFPLLVNAILGLRSVDQDQIAMFKSFGATKGQVFRKLQFPSALPHIFAGLNTAAILATTGAIVAEFVGATEGLGYLIQATNFSLDIAKTFAILIVLSIIGLTLHSVINWAARRVVFWSPANTSKS